MNTTELTPKEKQAQKMILDQIEKSMDLLKDHLHKFCKDNNAGSVPMVYIETSMKILIHNMRTGAES